MKTKLVIMDVDGTLTDGKIYMSTNGELCKCFSIKDGYGIHDILIPNGIVPVIITGRKSKIVKNRCNELGIKEVYQGISNKSQKLEEVLEKLSIKKSEAAYIGDDLNDLPGMQFIKNGGGIVGCPQDASEEVQKSADYICIHNGGDGAVREFIDWIIKKEKNMEIFENENNIVC